MTGNCGCGKGGKHSHSMKGVIDGIYSMKGENYLSPTNKTIADGFWSAGQPGHKKGGKN